MRIYWYGKSKNIIGPKLRELRKAAGLSQEELAAQLQLRGHEFSALSILRIEKGQRFVPDYEVVALAGFFSISSDTLLNH